jgi:N-acetylornithine carbamoyltransferase
LRGAQVIYAKEWGCTMRYGDSDTDAELRAGLTDWCVRSSWFEQAAADCRFMHCLPVRRNVAVMDEVLDGPRSAVQTQAFNRLTTQMAVLHRMLRRP